ncbi:MAG: hypothetical protein DYG96_05965, partial [Chlorobi bacterium CHB2]|nr:hypothetical protein [Chlorobi bacterium CHB2]
AAPGHPASSQQVGIQLRPNPATGETVLWLPAPTAAATPQRVVLATMIGTIVMVKEVAAGEPSLLLPLGGLPAGVYHVGVAGGAQRQGAWLHVGGE